MIYSNGLLRDTIMHLKCNKEKHVLYIHKRYQDQFLADNFSAIVKATQHSPKKTLFAHEVLEVVGAMEQASKVVTIDDMCLCAATYSSPTSLSRIILSHKSVRETFDHDTSKDDVAEKLAEWTLENTLAIAAYYGHEGLVQELIPKRNLQSGWIGYGTFGDPLEIAIARGQTNIMFMLLNQDEDFKRFRALEMSSTSDFASHET